MLPYLAWITFLALSSPALAVDSGQWENQPPEVRAWYRGAQLTPEARRRLGYVSCCAHADVVETRFRVNKTDGGDEWFWMSPDGWRRIPPDIIHWGEFAPGGRPTLFVVPNSTTETCFYPGEGGG